ncbi:ArsR family transcriptional regulator [Streptomyces albus]|uniref:ArsR family transcriptional regulator n=1 Tax=Streptomyces albus TaxID=1888 RepID=UPI0033F44916
MIRIHLTAADFARVRFAPGPAPLQELNMALAKMMRPDDALLFGRWRTRLLRALPAAAKPFSDLVPAGRAPAFLDVFSNDLAEGLETVRSFPTALVRSEIERVHAPVPGPPPRWIRALHRGDDDAWQLLHRAQRAAFDAALRPVWSRIKDSHQEEFTRYALTAAEQGTAAALTALLPGSRLRNDTWELDAPWEADVTPDGHGLVLHPTFHGLGHPFVAALADGAVHLTYPAGPGLPLAPEAAGTPEHPLAPVLGRTRLHILLLLAEEHTTGGLARRLRISNATVSAHTAALRGGGLITTSRAGRAVLHRRTALGTLLLRRHSGSGRPGAPPGF